MYFLKYGHGSFNTQLQKYDFSKIYRSHAFVHKSLPR